MELDQLKLQVEEKLYPPRFQIAAGGSITENVLAKFSFKGAMETLNGVVLLETSGITLSPLLKFLSIIFSFFLFIFLNRILSSIE